MLKLIGKMVKQVCPKFNYRDTSIATYSGGDDTFLEYYSPDNPGKTFAKYYVWKNELRLNRDLFETLENYFGEDNMIMILDWFNQEFSQDAETLTF